MLKNFVRLIGFALALLTISAPVQAQMSVGYKFIKAMKDLNGEDATKILNENPTTIINTRELNTKQTGLYIVVKQQNSDFTGFLLQKGADANLPDSDGVTPLMVAAQLGWDQGAKWLLAYDAKVDATNHGGETALILATHLRYTSMVKLLIENGANPDKKDHVAGLSARGYATQDTRAGEILALFDKPKAETSTKGLDFSGISANADAAKKPVAVADPAPAVAVSATAAVKAPKRKRK